MLLQVSEQSRVVLSPKIAHLDMLLTANSIATTHCHHLSWVETAIKQKALFYIATSPLV